MTLCVHVAVCVKALVRLLCLLSSATQHSEKAAIIWLQCVCASLSPIGVVRHRSLSFFEQAKKHYEPVYTTSQDSNIGASTTRSISLKAWERTTGSDYPCWRGVRVPPPKPGGRDASHCSRPAWRKNTCQRNLRSPSGESSSTDCDLLLLQC